MYIHTIICNSVLMHSMQSIWSSPLPTQQAPKSHRFVFVKRRQIKKEKKASQYFSYAPCSRACTVQKETFLETVGWSAPSNSWIRPFTCHNFFPFSFLSSASYWLVLFFAIFFFLFFLYQCTRLLLIRSDWIVLVHSECTLKTHASFF